MKLERRSLIMSDKKSKQKVLSIRISEEESKSIDEILKLKPYLTVSTFLKETLDSYLKQNSSINDSETAKAIRESNKINRDMLKAINEQTKSNNEMIKAFMATQVMLKENTDKVDLYTSLTAQELELPEVISDEEELFESYKDDLPTDEE